MLFGIFLAFQIFASNFSLLADDSSSSSSMASHCIYDFELEASLASLFTEEFGYTLVGAKPVSILEGGTNCYLYMHPEVRARLFAFLKKAFHCSDRFIFRPAGEKYEDRSMELIHKAALRRMIFENQDLGAFVKGRFGDVNSFFAHLQHSEDTIFKTFDYNAFLLGLVFGYGRDNSEYYCRRIDVGSHLKKAPLYSLFSNGLKPHIYCHRSLLFFSLDAPSENCSIPSAKNDFESLEEEWDWIEKVRWDLHKECEPRPPYYVALPCYICRHGGDSECVYAQYLKARDRLADLFYDRFFVDVIIAEASGIDGKNMVLNSRCN